MHTFLGLVHFFARFLWSYPCLFDEVSNNYEDGLGQRLATMKTNVQLTNLNTTTMTTTDLLEACQAWLL